MTVPAAGAIDGSQSAQAEQGLRRSLALSLGVGLVALLALAITSVVLFARGQSYSHWVDHTYAAENKINALTTLIERVETARRGYLLSPHEQYLDTYTATRAQIEPALIDLERFTADNPRQQANIHELSSLVAQKLTQLQLSLETAQSGDVEGARRLFVEGRNQQLTQRLRATLARMDAEEGRLLATRARHESDNSALLVSLIVGVAVLLAALSVGATLLMRRFAGDLRRSEAELKRLNEGLEEAVRDRTADLTRANEEIQRFAYIVSHDLRSPLVNVMGFTSELEAVLPALKSMIAQLDETATDRVSRDARSAVEIEIPEAIGFIRASTRKMDRLINAILKLSREGRRTLTPEALSMEPLIQGVMDSIRQVADARGAELAVEGELPDCVGDRVAMEQLFGNLIENAVKYLKPGRPGRVVVRGGAQGERNIYEVQDNGRGIDVKDHERIFELFRRSGAQDQPGEGIGLAHVRALVYRLGGTITVDSALGEGATFRVSLPRRLVQDQGNAA